MGYVLYKLYHSIELPYPPKLDGDDDAGEGGLDAFLSKVCLCGCHKSTNFIAIARTKIKIKGDERQKG
jgi:hypothetical protein